MQPLSALETVLDEIVDVWTSERALKVYEQIEALLTRNSVGEALCYYSENVKEGFKRANSTINCVDTRIRQRIQKRARDEENDEKQEEKEEEKKQKN